jgi:hypothetical protein
MQKTLSRTLLLLLALSWSADLPAASREQTSGNLTRTRTAVYKLYQRLSSDTSLTEIGSETFTIRNYDDNTIIVDGEFKMDFGLIGCPSDVLQVKSHLEVEEESLFPRRFEMIKSARGVDQEIKIEMISNVAVIDYRFNKTRENFKRVVTNGTMIVEASQLSQRWLLLQRFGIDASSKLSMTVLDPILKRESSAVLDYQGEKTATVRGEAGTFKLFKLSIEKKPVMQLYLDDTGMIVQADNGAQQFVLDDFSDETVQGSSGE